LHNQDDKHERESVPVRIAGLPSESRLTKWASWDSSEPVYAADHHPLTRNFSRRLDDLGPAVELPADAAAASDSLSKQEQQPAAADAADSVKQQHQHQQEQQHQPAPASASSVDGSEVQPANDSQSSADGSADAGCAADQASEDSSTATTEAGSPGGRASQKKGTSWFMRLSKRLRSRSRVVPVLPEPAAP
jgi:hypothetical protein